MTYSRFKIDLATALSVLLLSANARSNPQNALAAPQTVSQCTIPLCANAAETNARGDVLEREGLKQLKAIRQSADDETRWRTVIYSDGTDEADFELTIIKSADFKIRLDPKLGTISLSSPKSWHVFAIHDPRARVNPCPVYDIRIVEASTSHALIRHVCPKREYRPGKFYMSNWFYLYDVQTGAARSIWGAAEFSKDARYPTANPQPSVQPIDGGYVYHWVGNYPGSEAGQMRLHNKYMRQTVDGKLALVCIDVSNPKRPAVENEMCEGEDLRKVVAH